MAEDQKKTRLVVVGSSAGGIEALSRLVATLPEGLDAPVVIAHHLDPEPESRLPEILSRRTSLLVRTVADHDHLEPGVVYVIPSDRHVNLTPSEIDLRVATKGRPKPSVDMLMSSAAGVFGEGLIAVVLTGTGSDGAEGARAVRQAGGTVIIQDPRTAEWFGASKDIHDREVAEAALRRNEERWRALIDKGSDVITISDRDGIVRFVSPSIETVCGHAVEEFVGRNPLAEGGIHPDDVERCGEAFGQLAGRPGHSFSIQHRYRHGSGEWRWLEGTFTNLFDDPAIGGLVANFRDVTDRKEAEEALRENEAWLRLAQSYAGSGTWEWNLRTDEMRWSDEHRELFGFALSDKPIGREDWWAAVHPEDLPRIEEAGRRCLEEDEEWPEIEYRIFREREVRWIAARGHTERDGAGRAFRILGISVDATERKEAEERDRLLAREWVANAEAAERERISRELHDRVAHSMGVAHQSLQLHEVLARTDARWAESKLDLAREMIKASLESTRNLSAELRRLDAEEGLEAELRHLLDVAVPPGIRAGIRVEGDEAGVPGHVRGQIFLVLREAVRNAVSHSGCGSLSVGLDIEPERVVGSVEDDGRGFDDTGGEGLGLRSMRERAALLDGALRLDCEPGRGTRVEVSVPLAGGR